MRTIPVYIAIQSHLSDSMIEMDFDPAQAQRRIRFVKNLLNKYRDTNTEISDDMLNEMWNTMK